jgi:ABC-type Fe2+-enterobactin transport system substrate-binding protein
MTNHSCLMEKTSAEIAGIKIEGQNKWITVIQNASRLQIKTMGNNIIISTFFGMKGIVIAIDINASAARIW